MPVLKWTDHPGIVTQSSVDEQTFYYVDYPARGLSDKYDAVASKQSIHYVIDGGPFNRDSDAQAACQRDYDQWGTTLPPGKKIPLPE